MPSLIWLSISVPRADARFWRICSLAFSRPRRSIASRTNRSSTADRFTGMWRDSGWKCGRLSRVLKKVELAGIGVDAWGVDYALLGERGELLQNPYHYRDRRTEGVMDEVFRKVPKEEIYRATGIQFMPINTLYQLFAEQRDSPKIVGSRKAHADDSGPLQLLADRERSLRIHQCNDNPNG